MLILLLFFCSGAMALVYEVLWSKYLALLFGSTIQAQTVVLAIFMGGLALGNRVFGARADRFKQPLAVYGYLESAVGLYAFFFSFIYRFADRIFTAAGTGLLEHPSRLLLLKGIVSTALLLGPTMLMGGTLPVLAAWLQRQALDAGRRAARFYSTNSLGAVCGAGLAGFFLVTWLGLPGTLQLTGLLNVLIGITALGVARGRRLDRMAGHPALHAQSTTPPFTESPPAMFRWACFLVTLTGAVSMGLEVLASRCLSMIFGASLQAFAIVLMAFILGIGLGSALVASRGTNLRRKELIAAALVLGASTWIGFLVYHIESLAGLYLYARSGLSNSSMGYHFNQLIAAGFGLFVLGVPAGAIGAVLPLCIRIVSETSDLLGDRVGRLLTWNTLGGVAGVLLTGFILMPGIGLRASFATLAMVLGLAGLAVAWTSGGRCLKGVSAVIGGFLVLVATTSDHHWRQVLSAGVFRFRGGEVSSSTLANWFERGRILFYEDAADATVSVEEDRLNKTGDLGLRVNGKPDASTKGDLSTQLLCAHLPLLVKPNSRDVFVLGLGSGVTAGAVLGYPVQKLVIAENCEPVIRAAAFFERWNNGVLTNARARLCREDARTVLKLSPQKYDVIIAEPSNPWTAGVGSVFSREFYQLASSRLKPGGIIVQWFHVYEMSDGIVSLVMRTFGTVFPVMEIWDASDGDILMLGAREPWESGPEVFRKAFAQPRPRQDLESIGLCPKSLMARQLASQRTAFAVAGPGPIQTDEFPVLEYAAPRAFFIGANAQLLSLYDERTWQADLAAPEKARMLASLDWSHVTSALGARYRSVNPDLRALIDFHASLEPASTASRLAGGYMPPLIFGPPQPIVLRPPPAAITNEVARRLFEAELALARPGTVRSNALAQIEQILAAAPAPQPRTAAWHAEYYAALTAKARLQLGQPEKAREVLLRGLALAPDSEQLGFLARVLAREGVVRAGEIPVVLASTLRAN